MTNIFLQEVLIKDENCDKVILLESRFATLGFSFLERKKQEILNFFSKTLADSKISRTFAPAIENESNQIMVW